METNQTTEIAIDNALICNNNAPLKGHIVAPPLAVGNEYKAINVITCVCGTKHIDVGLKSDYNYITCFECKEILPDVEIHWCHPSRFDLKK